MVFIILSAKKFHPNKRPKENTFSYAIFSRLLSFSLSLLNRNKTNSNLNSWRIGRILLILKLSKSLSRMNFIKCYFIDFLFCFHPTDTSRNSTGFTISPAILFWFLIHSSYHKCACLCMLWSKTIMCNNYYSTGVRQVCTGRMHENAIKRITKILCTTDLDWCRWYDVIFANFFQWHFCHS